MKLLFGRSTFRFNKTLTFNTIFNFWLKNMWLKSIALTLILSLLAPHIAWTFQSTNYVLTTANFKIINLNNRTLLLPKTLGSVVQTFQGQDKLIIHIEDLHCHEEVQMNIAQLIKHLAQTANLTLIGQEGAFNSVNVDLIKTFPNQAIAKSISRHYVKQGKMTGAEYGVAHDPHDLRLEGIDSPTLYKDSKQYLKTFFNHESLGFCYDLKEALINLKPKLYHPPLHNWDQLHLAYDANQLTEKEYATHLINHSKALGIATVTCPATLSLAQTPASADILWTRDQLFSEFEQLDQQIRAALYQDDEQANLDRLLYYGDIMERLLNISATNEERQLYQDHQQDFLIKKFLAFINQYQPTDKLDDQLYQLDHYINQVMQFYNLADKRSDYFVEQLVARMNHHQQDLSVMIAGGFHSSAILRNLEQQNISYISIKPTYTNLSLTNPYFSLLLGQATNLEKTLSQFQSSLALQTIWPDGDLPGQSTKDMAELLLESSMISYLYSKGYNWATIIKKMKQLIARWPADTNIGIALTSLGRFNSNPSQSRSIVTPSLRLLTTLKNKLNQSMIIEIPNAPSPDESLDRQTIVGNQHYLFKTISPASDRASTQSSSSPSSSWLWLLRTINWLLNLFIKIFKPIFSYRPAFATFSSLIPPPTSTSSTTTNTPQLMIGPGKMSPWIPTGPVGWLTPNTKISFQATNLNLSAPRQIDLSCEPYTLGDIDEYLPDLLMTDNQTAISIVNWFKQQPDKQMYLLEENNDFGISALGEGTFYGVDPAFQKLPLAWFYAITYNMAAQNRLTVASIYDSLPRDHQLWLAKELSQVDDPQLQLWIAIDTMVDAAYPQAHQELQFKLQHNLPRHTLEAIAKKYGLRDVKGFITAYLEKTAHLQLNQEIAYAQALAEVHAVHDRIALKKVDLAVQIQSVLEQAQHDLSQPLTTSKKRRLIVSIRHRLNELDEQSSEIMIETLAQALLEQLSMPLQTNPSNYQLFLMNYSFSKKHPHQSTSIIITMCHHLLHDSDYPSYDTVPLVLANLDRFFDTTDLSFTGKTWEAMQILLQDSLLHNIAMVIPGDEVRSITGFMRYFKHYRGQGKAFYFRRNFRALIHFASIDDQVHLDKLYTNYVFKRDVTLLIYDKLLEKPIRHEVLNSLIPHLETLPSNAPTRIATLSLLLKHWQHDILLSTTNTLIDLVVDSYQTGTDQPTRFHLEEAFDKFYQHLVTLRKSDQLLLPFYQKLSTMAPQDSRRLALLNLITATQQRFYNEKQVNLTLELIKESYQVAQDPQIRQDLELAFKHYYQGVTAVTPGLISLVTVELLVEQIKELSNNPTLQSELVLIVGTSDLLKDKSSILDELIPLMVNAYHSLAWDNLINPQLKPALYQALSDLRIHLGANRYLRSLVDPILSNGTIAPFKVLGKKEVNLRSPLFSSLFALYITLHVVPSTLSFTNLTQWLLVLAIGAPLLTAYLLWKNAHRTYRLIRLVKHANSSLISRLFSIDRFFNGAAGYLNHALTKVIQLEQAVQLPLAPTGFSELINHRSTLNQWQQFLAVLLQARIMQFLYSIRHKADTPDLKNLMAQPALNHFLSKVHYLLIIHHASPSLQQTVLATTFKAKFLPQEINLVHFIWLLLTKQLKQSEQNLVTVYYPYHLVKWFYLSQQLTTTYPTVAKMFETIMILNHNMFIKQFKPNDPRSPSQPALHRLPNGLKKLNQLLLPLINKPLFRFTPIKSYWLIMGLSILLWLGFDSGQGPLVWTLAFSFITTTSFVTKQALATAIESEKTTAPPWGFQLMFNWPWLRWALWKIAPHHYWVTVLTNTTSLGPYQDIILPLLSSLKQLPATSSKQVHQRYLQALQNALDLKLELLSPDEQQILLTYSISLFQEVNPPSRWSHDYWTVLKVNSHNQWIQITLAPAMGKLVGNWLAQYRWPVLYQPHRRKFMLNNAV